MKKKKDKILFWMAIIVLIVAFISFSIALFNYFPNWFGLERRIFYTSVNITTDRAGFDLNTSALTFGKVKIGGSATRNIIFENQYNFPVIVRISSKGSITPLLNYEKEVRVGIGETKKIGFNVVSQSNISLGYYDGFIDLRVMPSK